LFLPVNFDATSEATEDKLDNTELSPVFSSSPGFCSLLLEVSFGDSTSFEVNFLPEAHLIPPLESIKFLIFKTFERRLPIF
jgi:hypothetical protein